MKILLGLGNPGPQYAGHRHNLGFWCADRLAGRMQARFRRADVDLWEAEGMIGGEAVVVAKPRTFMNRSGRAAGLVLRRHRAGAADLIVAHDDADLDFGRVRVKQGGGHGGHNGLRSILEVLAEPDFIRVRMGLGRPASALADLADWVLEGFAADERGPAEKMAEQAADAVETIIGSGVKAAMDRFNVR